MWPQLRSRAPAHLYLALQLLGPLLREASPAPALRGHRQAQLSANRIRVGGRLRPRGFHGDGVRGWTREEGGLGRGRWGGGGEGLHLKTIY